MSQIKKFIDRVSTAEGRQVREVILPLSEAKQLRDEISKLLVDKSEQKGDNEIIEVVVNGGSFK